MLKYFTFLFSTLLAITLGVSHVQGQITTTIGNISGACVGDTITVPVTVTMNAGISVAAISMAIDYDSTKLTCISAVTSLNPSISAGFLSNCGFFTNLNPNPPYSASSRRQFRVAWFNLVPVAFNGLMFNMRFVVLSGGSSAVQWDLATAGNCEYADEFADVIPVPTSGWVSGSISAGTPGAITSQPSGNLSILDGANTSISVTGSAGATYQWQSLSVGGSWSSVSNTAPYSGATTATLNITGATVALNGTQYRVIVTGSCGSPVTSNSVALSVTGVNSVGLSAGNINGCQGDTVNVPLSATGLSGVTALTFKLNLPAGAVYVGLNGFATGLGSATGSTLGGLLTITWSGSAFTQASGTLMNVRMVLPGQPGSLTWDATSSVTPNATLSFTNSSVAVTPLPSISSQPASTVTVGEFQATTISVVALNATTYRWQRQGTGNTWSDLTDGATYSGTGTAILNVLSATSSLNNARYRLRMLGGSCPTATLSSTCTLTVTPMQISLNAIGTTACAGDTVRIPVRINGAVNIANMSIYLQYSASNLQYLGFDSLYSPGISVQAQTSPSPRIFISYNVGAPISINNFSTVCRLRFRALGASSLTWTNNSDFSNSNGDTIAYSQITLGNSTVGVTEAIITPAGPTSFCTGGSVVLNGNSITGASYAWFNGSTPIAGATTATYTASTSGTYRFFISVPGGCADTSNSVVVTTSIPPVAAITASGPTTFCQGGSVGLVATRGNGFTYRWYRDAVRLSALAPNTDSIGALQGGTYRVVVINAGNCLDSTTTGIVVTVNPKPRPPQITRPTVSPASDSLYANIRNQNNITWFRNGVALTGGADGVIRITGNGIYRAMQDSNGCRSDSSNAIIVTGVGVLENSVNSLNVQLYPNPNQGRVFLIGSFDNKATKTMITVTNTAGQEVLNTHLEGVVGEFRHELNLENIVPGIYFVLIQRDDRYVVLRFVRE
ncbi:MAG: T9SS type A sorting domain-containing protein [Sphingomonadales bacterium]|nr:T9SS type A sorting domain-containing protein [Sphingomonadales bacterium]